MVAHWPGRDPTAGESVGSGRVEHTEGIGFGYDNMFTGTIKWLELEGGEDSHDQLIDPEDFINVAMAKQ